MRVITLARKPLQGGSVAENVLRYGTGGLNIDSCRIGSLALLIKGGGEKYYGPKNSFYPLARLNEQREGRFPANVILEHRPPCCYVGSKTIKPIGGGASANQDGTEEAPAWECVPGCPVKVLDEQSGDCGGSMDGRLIYAGAFGKHGRYGLAKGAITRSYADTGTASRFFKQVKRS